MGYHSVAGSLCNLRFGHPVNRGNPQPTVQPSREEDGGETFSRGLQPGGQQLKGGVRPQGSLNGTHFFLGMKQYKSMVILKDIHEK